MHILIKFVPTGLIDNNWARTLFGVMAWRRTGEQSLHGVMLTHKTHAQASPGPSELNRYSIVYKQYQSVDLWSPPSSAYMRQWTG